MVRRYGTYRIGSGGFTIVELLVAISVLSMVVAIVYESFTSVLDSTELARDQAEQLRFRQYLWRNLTENLSSVYSDAACMSTEYQLLGTDKDGASGPADTLRFCTSMPMSGPQALPGVLKVVSYEVTSEYSEDEGATIGKAAIDETAADAEEKPLMLIIREEPLILESAANDQSVEDVNMPVSVRRIPIASMDLQYYDGDADEWRTQWDSLEESRMPWAIQVRINFPRTEEELSADYQAGINPSEEPDLNMTIPLPSGRGVTDQFLDINHKRSTGEEEISKGDLFGKDSKSKKSGKSTSDKTSTHSSHSSSHSSSGSSGSSGGSDF